MLTIAILKNIIKNMEAHGGVKDTAEVKVYLDDGKSVSIVGVSKGEDSGIVYLHVFHGELKKGEAKLDAQGNVKLN